MPTPARMILGPCAACRRLSLLAAGLLLALPGLVRAADPPAVTDAAVDSAVRRAVTWLKAQHAPDKCWEDSNQPGGQFWDGTSALTILALLYAGEDPRTQFMDSALDWVSRQPVTATYVFGTRAHALALVPGDKYRSRLEDDLKWLVDNVGPRGSDTAGAYGYTGPDSGGWDNSNSQYGVLGVWMATDAGLTAPPGYWELVGEHWLHDQASDGGWGYHAKDHSTGSMTAAGLASLYVVLDRLYADRPKDSARVVAAINQALSWFGREFTPENPFGDPQWLHYYLYGVERVGRASGRKYFRNRDWFREGAAYLLSKQEADGYWHGTGGYMSDLRNTDFALMFLCHGRAPLLLNKLEHGPDWDHKLRDASGLTHYAQHTLERLLNWQIVRLDGPLDDLMEAPLLYLCGQKAWEFSEAEVQKIRDFCLRGGMVLAVQGRGGSGFAASIRTLAEQAFPEHPLHELPSDHPLFNGEIQFAIDKPPVMQEVHSGIRTLLLLCEDDIADAWNRGKGRADHFQLGCNIYNYATDKASIRSRLETSSISPREVEVRRKIKVALIKYAGRWNIEPYGWTRLKNYLNNETGTRLLVTSGLTLDSKELKDFDIVFITGLSSFELSAAEQDGLKRFLRGGGTLLADAAGGSDEFRKSLEGYLVDALKVEPKRLPADSCIVTGRGIPDAVGLTDVGYTRAAHGRTGGQGPPLWAYNVGSRLAAIYSPLDVSVDLLGTHVYNCRGFDGDGALRVLRNLLLYADLPAKEKARLMRP